MNESNDYIKNSGRVSSQHCYQWQSHDWTSAAHKSECPSTDEFYKLARHSNVNLLGEYQRTPVTFFWVEGKETGVLGFLGFKKVLFSPTTLFAPSKLGFMANQTFTRQATAGAGTF